MFGFGKKEPKETPEEEKARLRKEYKEWQDTQKRITAYHKKEEEDWVKTKLLSLESNFSEADSDCSNYLRLKIDTDKGYKTQCVPGVLTGIEKKGWDLVSTHSEKEDYHSDIEVIYIFKRSMIKDIIE